MTYPMNVGRNFAEILRVIDALQTTSAHNVAHSRRLGAVRRGHYLNGGCDRRGAPAFYQWLDRDAPVPAPHDAAIARGRAVVV